MTVNRLAVALTALTMLVGLSVPALAGARGGSGRRLAERRQRIEKRHPRTTSPTGCKLSLAAEPRTLTAGEAPQVFGRLHCPGASAAAQTVTLFGHSVGQANQAVGTTTTDSGGYFTLVAPAPATDTLYYVTAVGATSPTKAVKVAPRGHDPGAGRNRGAADGRTRARELQRHRQPRRRGRRSGPPARAGGRRRRMARDPARGRWEARGILLRARLQDPRRRQHPGRGASPPALLGLRRLDAPVVRDQPAREPAADPDGDRLGRLERPDPVRPDGQPPRRPRGRRRPDRSRCRRAANRASSRPSPRPIANSGGGYSFNQAPQAEHRLQGARRRPPLGGPVRGRQIRAHGRRPGAAPCRPARR